MNTIPDEYKMLLYRNCYLSNNNFAYKYDTNDNYENELKIYNFVPTYDKWCLRCLDRDARYKCSDCKAVYFCGRECQRKCWKVHKKHCKRNLFSLCSTCGSDNITLKCDKCPVKFCSDKCKNQIYGDHKEFDCEYFHKTFGEKYLDFE